MSVKNRKAFMSTKKSFRSLGTGLQRAVPFGGLAAASAILAACGAPDEAYTESEAVAEIEAVQVDCATIQPSTPVIDVKKLVGMMKDIVVASKTPTLENAAKAVGSMLEFPDMGPSVDAQLHALNEKLFCLAAAADWREVALDYNNLHFAPVSAAFMTAQSVPFPRLSSYDESSHTATVGAGGREMFQRLYNPNDRATDGPWKLIMLKDNQPVRENNFMFDWRMALPGFMRLLTARIGIIGTIDRNFATNQMWNPELGDGSSTFPGYRGVLKSRLDEMLSGVRCGYSDHAPPSQNCQDCYYSTDIACADVNTGLYATTTYVRQDAWQCRHLSREHEWEACLSQLASQTDVNNLMYPLRRNVRNQMPIFEVQSTIDVLTHYTRPLPDLTEQLARIPLVGDKGLCLDVPGANSTPGTALQVYPCNGTAAQQFSYDRKSQTIRNTAINKCVQVRPHRYTLFGHTYFIDNIEPGAVAEIADCTSPAIPRQRWSYDPELGVIRSQLGTELDVQFGNLAPGTPVWLWSYTNGHAQRWFADRTSTECYGFCQQSCLNTCTAAGHGTDYCDESCWRLQGCTVACLEGP